MKKLFLIALTGWLLIFSSESYVLKGTEEKIKIDLFMMSMCPFGIQAENTLIPIIKELGDKVQLNLYFIASENERKSGSEDAKTDSTTQPPQPASSCVDYGGGSNGNFRSLHGEKEVQEDIRQLVIMQFFKSTFYDYLLQRNQDIDNTDPVAIMKTLGIDAEFVEKMINLPEGEELLKSNIKETNSKGINASPTLFVNDRLIEGGITGNRIIRAMCKVSGFPICSNLPVCGSDYDCDQRENQVAVCVNPETTEAKCIYGEDFVFNINVITEPRLSSLNQDELLSALKSTFSKAEIKYLDYNSDEGKKLTSDYSLDVLPAIIIDGSIEKSVRFVKFAQYLKKQEDKYIFKSEYLPNRYYINRPYIKNTIEIFVNSFSANSARLENYLLAAKKNSFTVNYNAYVVPKKNDNQLLITKKENIYELSQPENMFEVQSRLGKDDLIEDMRQLCINKYNPELIYSYLRCVNNELFRNLKPEKCFELIVSNKGKVTECINKSEGIEMLARNSAYGRSLKVDSDVGVLLNNRVLLQDFDLNQINEILEKF